MDLASRVTLRQLELFCAAAEHGSFTAASQALFLTPNAVALAVRELEQALGVQLFVRRRSHGATLTPSGTHLLARARRLLRDADDLCRSVGTVDGRLSGPVAVGCYSTLAATVLPPLLEGFGQRHPGIALSFVDGTVTELLPQLTAGTIDVLIAYRSGLPAGLEQAVLYETEAHVLLPEHHRLAGSPTVSLADLRDDPLILLDLPPSGDHTLKMLDRAGVTPTVAHRTSNFELVRSLVARGFGYSYLIQKPLIDESYEGRRLVAKRISPPSGAEAVVITWARPLPPTDRSRALIDYATRTVAQQQWTPRGDASQASAGRGRAEEEERREEGGEVGVRGQG